MINNSNRLITYNGRRLSWLPSMAKAHIVSKFSISS